MVNHDSASNFAFDLSTRATSSRSTNATPTRVSSMPRLGMIRLAPLLFLLVAMQSLWAAELKSIPNCKLEVTDWADGDSFLIHTPAGQFYTIRLYGVDCVELHIGDATDARRLRSQRRYFGITEFGGSAEKSIELAKSYGQLAKGETVKLLSKPFTVHTAFADGRGDGKHKRIYAFIELSSGEDLGASLVAKGLARAYGVARSTYKGQSQDEMRESLADLELQAAKRDLGIWAKTDWENLPEERRQEREEEEMLALAVDGGGGLPPGAKVNINTAARDELMLLPGIGEITANRIIEKRPFNKVEDLTKVSGIGEGTLKKLRESLVVE